MPRQLNVRSGWSIVPAPPLRRNSMNTKSADLSSEMESDVSKAISGAEDMLTRAASSTGEKAAELRDVAAGVGVLIGLLISRR
jgi:ElaB/YqjD/DUF883 family membrane-anchored ribosome-binding protein